MFDRDSVINDLNVAKLILCNPQMLTPEICIRIGQAITSALALLKEQEAKTGYWIDSAGNDKCSICGTEYSDLYPDYGNTHFCPNCGAKMEGR